MSAANLHSARLTRKDLAALFSVSERSIATASFVTANAVPEISEAVMAGRMTLNCADFATRNLQADEQREFAALDQKAQRAIKKTFSQRERCPCCGRLK